MSRQRQLCRDDFSGAGNLRLREDVTVAVYRLRDSGAGDAKNGDAVFRRAHGGDARMEFVLMHAPGFHIHRRADEELRPLLHQPVGHARVAQIVADANADLAPRRIPDGLLRCGQTIAEELDGHALDLLKHDVAIRAHDKGGVVIVVVREDILASDNEVARVCAAPIFQRIRHAAVERVFAQDEDGRVGVFGEGLIKDFRQHRFVGEFHLDADER